MAVLHISINLISSYLIRNTIGGDACMYWMIGGDDDNGCGGAGAGAGVDGAGAGGAGAGGAGAGGDVCSFVLFAFSLVIVVVIFDF